MMHGDNCLLISHLFLMQTEILELILLLSVKSFCCVFTREISEIKQVLKANFVVSTKGSQIFLTVHTLF